MQTFLQYKIKLRRIFVILLALLVFLPSHSVANAKADQNYIFLIDLSGSMNGQRLVEAKSALNSILESESIAGKVSIVGFDTKVRTLFEPSYDKKKAIEVVNSLRAYGNTALFDGVSTALKIAKSQEDTTIIVLTDGKDTSSRLKVDQIAKLVDGFQGQLHFLSLSQDPGLKRDLSIVTGNKGTVTDVTRVSDLLKTLQPLIFAGNSSLVIDKAEDLKKDKSYINGIVLLIASFLLIILSILFFRSKSNAKKARLRLLQAFDDELTKNKEVPETSLFYLAMRFAPFHAYVKNEEKRLLGAGLSLNIRSWIYLQITIFIFGSLFLMSIGFTIAAALLVAGFFGFGVGKIYLNSTRAKKSKAFAEELPDTLVIISSSLKSGLSFTQAIESVAREGDSEVALQFRRVLAEVQLGKLLTDSLLDVADRMDSTDFRWTISALSIQREVGGNLSEILSTTAETIRGRSEIRREVKALSAEGRMSAYVLVALPFFMMLYLQLTKPEYIKIMFTHPIGIVLMVIVAILMIVGWVWTKKVVEIKFS